MKRFTVSALFVSLLAMSWVLGHDVAGDAASHTSGQGKMTFRVLYTSSHLPPQAQKEEVLKAAHGGFAVDRRPGKGETYFALPGAGIIQISADMKSTMMLKTSPGMRDTNMHNATIWYAKDGTPFLTFPRNKSAKVYTTTIDGKLVHTLDAPAGGTDLGHPAASDYFAGAGNFVPTDTEQLDGLLYVATGYSKLDYVLTARILSTNPFKALVVGSGRRPVRGTTPGASAGVGPPPGVAGRSAPRRHRRIQIVPTNVRGRLDCGFRSVGRVRRRALGAGASRGG